MLKLREEVGLERIRETVFANDFNLTKAPHREQIVKCVDIEVEPRVHCCAPNLSAMAVQWDAGRTAQGDIITMTWPGQANVALLLETTSDEAAPHPAAL